MNMKRSFMLGLQWVKTLFYLGNKYIDSIWCLFISVLNIAARNVFSGVSLLFITVLLFFFLLKREMKTVSVILQKLIGYFFKVC